MCGVARALGKTRVGKAQQSSGGRSRGLSEGAGWNGSGGEEAAAGRRMEAELLGVFFAFRCHLLFHVITRALHIHYLQYNPMRLVFVSHISQMEN